MSRKLSRRNVPLGEKIKINDKRPLPEDPLEMTWKVDHIDGYRSTANKISFPDLVSVKPITCSDGSSEDDDKGRMLRLEDSFNILHGRLWDYECFDTGSSSWDQSVTSFMSWSDEIEAATTENVQVLMDNLECLLYGETTLNNPGKNLVDECAYWRNKFPHLRVKGTPISLEPCEEDIETNDENFEEIFAIDKSDDYTSEKGVLNDFDEKPRKTSNSNSGLQQKVKEAVIDHLVSYISSEVLKSLFQKYEEESTKEEANRSYMPPSLDSQTSGREYVSSPLRSDTPFLNIQESDLDSILLVSPKSLHQNAKISPVMSRQESATCSRASFHPLQISDIRENTIDYPSFSVLGVGRQLSIHAEKSFSASPCSLTESTFHSATERRKKHYIDRRFSCGTLGHTKFLQPLDENHKKLASTTINSKRNDKHMQSSAPNSPDKMNRHFILPPIENADVSKRNQTSSLKPKSWLPSSRPSTTTSKQQVPISPINIPDSIDLNEIRLSRLDIQKEPLKKTSYNGRLELSAKSGVNFGSDRRRHHKIKTNLFD